MKTGINNCPEFPFFGARYPDARCIEGKLYDLDKCDENGALYEPGEDWPCPFCRTEEFIKQFAEYKGIKYKDARKLVKSLKEKYGYNKTALNTQPKQDSAGSWIKASEQLPPIGVPVIIRDKEGSVYQDKSYSWSKRVTDYEWLDKSQPRQDSAGVWISVEDKLPNEKDSCDDYYNEVLTLQLGSKRPVMMKYWEVKNSPFVKYWMPLPTPPESQKED